MAGCGSKAARIKRDRQRRNRMVRRFVLRLIKKLTLLLALIVRKTARVNIRFWVVLGPFQAALALWLVSLLAAQFAFGWVTLLGVMALCTGFVYWLTGQRMPLDLTRRRLDNKSTVWAFGGYAVAALLSVLGAALGAGPPMPALWLAWALTTGWHWWWGWHGVRNPAAEPVREAAGVDHRLQLWFEHPPAAYASLFNMTAVDKVIPGELVPTTIGWRADGAFEMGKGSIKNIKDKLEEVAALYDTTVENVAIEPGRNSARKFSVTVFEKNPLQHINRWAGPQDTFDPETGIASIGTYADCESTLYRFYQRGSGPVHDLIAGTTGSGKSRLVEQLLAVERASPFMASVVIDPQRGQSLPAFKSMKNGTIHRTAGFATTTEEALFLLQMVQDEMYARNAYLAELGWTETDEEGNEFEEEGVDSFDPLSGPTAGMKLIVLTIDEAHAVLANKDAKEIVEDIAKMSRKCGIKLRLITQVPLLDQLGGSTTLRDMVAAGNVIVLRTANALSAAVAFNGNLPADPKSLPREWEIEDADGSIKRVSTAGLGYVMGPGSRPVPMRTFFVPDIRKYARAGETTEVEMLDPELQGVTLNDLLGWFRLLSAGRLDQVAPAVRGRFSSGSTLDRIFGIDGPAQSAIAGVAPPEAEKPGGWKVIETYLKSRPDGASKVMIRQACDSLSRKNVDSIVRRRINSKDLHEATDRGAGSGWYRLGPAPAKSAAQLEAEAASLAETA